MHGVGNCICELAERKFLSYLRKALVRLEVDMSVRSNVLNVSGTKEMCSFSVRYSKVLLFLVVD